MKKIVAIGDFVLLQEVSIEAAPGDLVVAESARGDRKYKVVNFGTEVDTELEVGDIVFVEPTYLVSIAIDEKNKFFMTNIKFIMGYEEK
jgi:hypothetical protein